MRRLGCIAVVALAVAAAVASAAGAAGPRLIEAGGVRFPDRAFILSVPTGVALDARRIHVYENGRLVSGLSVVSGSKQQRKQFGVVLAIDASNSMHGAPIRAAYVAARAFAARRNPDQPVAIVTFNSEVRVLLPFTTDWRAIDHALRQEPHLSEGTRIYDAMSRALTLLREAHIEAGSIVLLSDGADVGSRFAAASVDRKVAAAHVRVFSVGLASPAFDPKALAALASATGGSYSQARTADSLTPIFDRLGYRLANEYLLRYRSLASPNEKVVVQVKVDGIRSNWSSGYLTPSLPRYETPPYHPSLSARLVESPLAMLIVAFAVGALVVTGTGLMLRQRRRRPLRARIAAFVSLAVPPEKKEREQQPRVSRLPALLTRPVAPPRWWERLQAIVEITGMNRTPAQIVVWTVLTTLFVMLVFSLLFGSVLGILFGVFVPIVARGLVLATLARKRRAFAEQLPDNLEVLASSLRAGHSLVGALSVVAEDAPEPSATEFRRVIADEQLGVPLEDALHVVVERMDNSDLEQVALVAALQRESGGNSAEVLDRVTESIRDRMELRRLVRTLTAQGRLSRWILTLIPVFLAFALSVLNPGYLHPLFSHASGRILLIVAAGMVVAGSLLIKRIVNIKV